MADSELQALYKTDRNPIQENRFQELLKTQGLSAASIGQGGNNADPNTLKTAQATNQAVQSAKAINDFQVQANQPAIAAYEASKTPLQDRYKSILDQIKGNQTSSENRQTLATNTELGKRGLASTSGVGQQELVNAVNPITAAYTGKYGEVAAQRESDIAEIQKAIAMLQSGNPAASIQAGIGINQSVQSANQFEQEMAMRQAQMDAENNRVEKNPYVTLSEGQTLFNYLTGQPVYTADKTYKPTAGGASATDVSKLYDNNGQGGLGSDDVVVPAWATKDALSYNKWLQSQR